MKRQSYSNLIKSLAMLDNDNRGGDRRHNDDPNAPVPIERRVGPRRAEDAPAVPLVPLPVRQSRALVHDNFPFISFEKIVPGAFYAKVLNDNTHEPVQFGKLIINGYLAIEREIAEYNKTAAHPVPLLSENILYHIEHATLASTNSRSRQFILFNQLFPKAKRASAEQAKSFAYDNDANSAEAVFVKNPGSPVFAKVNYKNTIIRLAKAKLNK